MAENKIRKVDSTRTQKEARAFAGPASAGVEWDTKAGLVVNPDNVVKRVVGPDRANWVELFDDFLGDAIASPWNTVEGTDSGTTDAAIVGSGLNGVLRLTTGDDAGASMAANGIQFESIANWKASGGNLVFEARVKLGAITNVAVFVGLTDQGASLEMPFTLSGTTYTSNASDAVGFLFDTAATTDTWRQVGVKADTDMAHADTGYAPVADTYELFRIEVETNGAATFFRNGVKLGRIENALTASVALNPAIAAFSRTNATKTVDVDFIYVGSTRA